MPDEITNIDFEEVKTGTQTPAPENKPEVKQDAKPEGNPLFQQKDNIKDIDALFEGKFKEPKTNFEQPKELETKETDEGPKEDPAIKSKKLGTLYFHLFDKPLVMGASLISGRERDAFRVSEADKKEMIEAWAEIAEAYEWAKPPAWMIILIFMGTVYGAMYLEAFKIRNQDRKKKRVIRPEQANVKVLDENGNEIQTENSVKTASSHFEDAIQVPAGILSDSDFETNKPKGGRPSKESELLERLKRKLKREAPELFH